MERIMPTLNFQVEELLRLRIMNSSFGQTRFAPVVAEMRSTCAD